MVYRSTDLGVTWQNVDNFVDSYGASAYSLAADFSGVIFATGNIDACPNNYSLVRRSADGGDTWSTVDQVEGDGAIVVTTDPFGSVFAFGIYYAGNAAFSSCRVSRDGGATWADSQDLSHGTMWAGACDGAGNVYSASLEAVTKLTAIRPTLTASKSGSSLSLSWPTNASGFVLQSATTLANGGDWQDSSLKATVVGDQNVVSVDTTAPTGFFRLRGQ
jgi:hypothetical protein